MPEDKIKPRWMRALFLMLKVYCVICTLLVTAVIPLFVKSNFFDQPPNPIGGFTEPSLFSAYGGYMAKEYPKRGDYFASLALSLGMLADATNVPSAEVLSYLGKPDLVSGSTNAGE